MIHDIDLAISICGCVQKVEAHGYVRGGMVEYARATLFHESGAFSNIVASRITEKRIRQINATCNDMYVNCNLLSKGVFVNKQTDEQYMGDVAITAREETIDVRHQEALLMEILDFVALCNGDPVEVPGVEDAVAAMRIADRVRRDIMGVASAT